MPVATHLHLPVVGTYNPVAVPCLVWQGVKRGFCNATRAIKICRKALFGGLLNSKSVHPRKDLPQSRSGHPIFLFKTIIYPSNTLHFKERDVYLINILAARRVRTGMRRKAGVGAVGTTPTPGSIVREGRSLNGD
jgi:hypothetical protein